MGYSLERGETNLASKQLYIRSQIRMWSPTVKKGEEKGNGLSRKATLSPDSPGQAVYGLERRFHRALLPLAAQPGRCAYHNVRSLVCRFFAHGALARPGKIQAVVLWPLCPCIHDALHRDGAPGWLSRYGAWRMVSCLLADSTRSGNCAPGVAARCAAA